MSNYTKITDYAAKDLLLHLDPLKAIKGSEVGAEFDAIATMSATKTDAATLAAAGGAALVGNTPAGNISATTVQAALNELDTEKAKVGANADITSMTALTAPTVAANPVRATDLQTQAVTRFTAAGTADAITGTLSPVPAALVTGLRVSTTPPGANTVTAPTLNVNALGAKKVFKKDSSGAAVALAAGDYNASGPFDFEYNTALDAAAGGWVLLNPIIGAGVSYPISIGNGGTGQTTAAAALSALGGVSTNQGHDAIGSFCFAAHATQATAIAAGSTYAGSALRAGGVLGTSSTISRASIDATALSGTWRALGTAAALTSNNGLTLFQRIA